MKTLRPFRDEDKDQVRSLFERSSLATAGPGPWEEDLKTINETYVFPGGCFLVVEEDSRIIAMGALRLYPNHEAEIKRMRVDPAFQRQGLGQQVLDALLQHANQVQVRRIFLDTDEHWTGARRFYEKNGFVQFEAKIWQGFMLILYEKLLLPAPR